VYTALALAAVYVLRTMARRFRTRDGDVGVPYGPSGDTPVALPDEETVGVP
jgi:hypothetical protein